MIRRFAACFLALLMVMTLLPFAAAEGDGEADEDTVSFTGGDLVFDPDTDTSIYYPVDTDGRLPYRASVEYDPPLTMYVYTENGGVLNVRSSPVTNTNNKVGELAYGAQVKVAGVAKEAGWYIIEFSKSKTGYGYVMSRFLVNSKPAARATRKPTEKPASGTTAKPVTPKPATAAPTSAPTAKPTADPMARKVEALNKQLATYRAYEVPCVGIVRATRSSGLINFRKGPGVAAETITTLYDGYQLRIIGETDNWYQASDPSTGVTGYIAKTYVTELTPVQEEPQTLPGEKEELGRLNVDGEFTLKCAVPEGYALKVITSMNARLIASIRSEDDTKPVLLLSVAYNEMYSDVERMNDLGPEDLEILEKSFTMMNSVEIGYRETAYGTKLLIARESGDDRDFVDILTVYRGYSVEFIMEPGKDASVLTDEQVDMCIDFLSDLDFVPAEKNDGAS